MHPEDKKKSADSTQATDPIDSPYSMPSTRSTHSALNTLSTAIFYLAILFFVIGFNFSDVMVGNWYQQFMPNLNGEPVSDIYFLDSLTGFAITGDGSPNDSNYILKTTNSGNNWGIVYTAYRDFFRIKFVNEFTGFTCGGFNVVGGGLFKTTNAGENWNQINSPSIIEFRDMAVIDENTIWLVDDNSLNGGVYRTTDGGASWQNQLNLGSQNPGKIYMFNSLLGFISKTTGQILYITTNSGENWTTLSTAGAFGDMYFSDNLTGWKTGVPGGTLFRKTTDGGLNWFDQTLPSGGNITYSQLENISGINKDTIWGSGPFLLTTQGFRGMINRTTNGGVNWLYQVPDSAGIQIGQYNFIDFVNKNNGWAYKPNNGVHTTTGGDPVWYTGIQQISSDVPTDYELKQNYPNPFNPRTVIPYSIKRSAFVRLIAYDILGRESQKLVESHHMAGEYEVDFMGKFSASGVYFYRMEVTDDRSRQLYTETKKMILLK